MAEFHDLAELRLNAKGQAWGNLGFWQDANDYSSACRALAERLGDAARLDKNSSVFDAGFGAGDQLLLWLQQYGVKRVCGVNFSHSQTKFAQKRLIDAGFYEDRVRVLYGDVDDPDCWKEAIGRRKISRVLALDCAYHFPSRKRFFEQALGRLDRGGRIALTDFIAGDGFGKGGISDGMAQTMFAAARIPTDNIVDEKTYLAEHEQTGFDDIELMDISDHVLPGFARWWRRLLVRETGRYLSLPLTSRTKYAVTARFLDWAWRNDILRYVLVTATKA